MARYYDRVEVGDELAPLEKEISRQAALDFCKVWAGPTGPALGRFTDEAAAKKEGLAGPILPGIMSMSLMANFLDQWAEGGKVKKLDVVFRQPVVHPQTLRLVGVVTDKNQTGGENQVECDVYLETPQGDRLVGGKATVLLPTQG